MSYDNNNNGGWGGPAGWDSTGTTYHYSYPRPEPSAPPTPPKKEKKKHPVLRGVALVLCCALIGGGAGIGGAALYDRVLRDENPQGETVIYQNTVDPVGVEVQQATGLKKMTLEEIYASYADSCVCITVQAIVQQGRYQYQASGAGSGFIITEDGYIVTNYHVIEGATAIKVTLNNGDSFDATLVGGEELNDVAVLKIDGITGLKPVVLGDSDDLVVGETVCTIGNALGTLSFSQTSGAISAMDRSVTMSDGTVISMIQTDCSINSGNSGGPLFDSYGRVAGIVSAKYSNNGDSSSAAIEGIGFAIPINDVVDIITDYMEYGYVTGRPSMGITVATVEEDHQQHFSWPAGVYVNSVESGSCAERAGIRMGDIITKLGDTPVTTVAELTSAKNDYKAGESASVTLYRAGETLTVTIVFDEQAQTTQEAPSQDSSSQGNGGYGYDYGYGYGDSGDYGNGYYFDPWSFFFGNGF